MGFGAITRGLGGEGAAVNYAQDQIRNQRREDLQDSMQKLYSQMEQQKLRMAQHKDWLDEQSRLVGTPVGDVVRNQDGSYVLPVRTSDGKITLQRVEGYNPQTAGQQKLDELIEERKRLKSLGWSDERIDAYQNVAPKFDTVGEFQKAYAYATKSPKENGLGLSGDAAVAYAERAAKFSGENKWRVPTSGKGRGTKTAATSKHIENLARFWERTGQMPASKERDQVEDYMQQKGMSPKPKYTVQEKQILEIAEQLDKRLNGAINPTNPVKSGLLTLIETAHLENDNGFKIRALMQKNWWQYKSGFKPSNPELLPLLLNAAALKIMGAAPWVRLGRGKWTFEQIQQHLPDTTDTPALMYEKGQFLQSIVDEAQGSIQQVEAGRQSQAQVSQEELDRIINASQPPTPPEPADDGNE